LAPGFKNMPRPKAAKKKLARPITDKWNGGARTLGSAARLGGGSEGENEWPLHTKRKKKEEGKKANISGATSRSNTTPTPTMGGGTFDGDCSTRKKGETVENGYG